MGIQLNIGFIYFQTMSVVQASSVVQMVLVLIDRGYVTGNWIVKICQMKPPVVCLHLYNYLVALN